MSRLQGWMQMKMTHIYASVFAAEKVCGFFKNVMFFSYKNVTNEIW